MKKLLFVTNNFNIIFYFLYFIVQYFFGIFFSAICFILPFKTVNPNIGFTVAALVSSFMFYVTSLGLEFAVDVTFLELKKRYTLYLKKEINELN